MMRSGKPLFVVESVEKAVKFYSEKLGFDLFELSVKKEDGRSFVDYAQLRKGKCFIGFKTPSVSELAEMSVMKHCAGRSAGVYIEMKKGFEKYLERCKKRGVTIFEQPKKQPWGEVTFSIKDPFGFTLTFSKKLEKEEWESTNDFCGMGSIEKPQNIEQEKERMENMIAWLKGFGFLRRVSKKFSKLWLKRRFGKKK